MSVNYYKSNLTSAEIDAALQAIDGLIGPQNNGKIMYVNNGKLAAKSAAEFEGAVLEPLSVTENGDYYPGDGTDGFDEVHVAVPGATLTTKSITQNGTYNASSDNADGYSSVTVNVSGGGSAIVQPLSVTQNGTYNPPSGVSGFAPVTVNVSGGGSTLLTPDYQGLSNAYVAQNGEFFQSNDGKVYFMNCFHVEANKVYLLFVGGVMSDRNRCAFYSGKTIDDFMSYIETGGMATSIYSPTILISPYPGEPASNIRYIFTPQSDGEVILVSSRSSVAAIAYCMEKSTN